MYDDRNYEITQDIGKILEAHKGFTTAYSNPRNGKILVRYHDRGTDEDNDFLLEITPLEEQQEEFRDTVDRYRFLFR